MRYNTSAQIFHFDLYPETGIQHCMKMAKVSGSERSQTAHVERIPNLKYDIVKLLLVVLV